MISGAMALRSRTIRQRSVRPPVTSMALRGSPLVVVPASQSLLGRMPCWPIAIRMRGPPTMLASADEKVAPKSPASTAGGKSERSMMRL